MARKKKTETTGSRDSYATAWDHFKQAATHAGRGAARDTADAYEWAKPRAKAAAQKAGEHIRRWYDNLSHDERYNAWRSHGIYPTSRASIKKVAGINGIDATDDAQILYELECKAYGAPRVGSISEIGKPYIKIDLEKDEDLSLRFHLEDPIKEYRANAVLTSKSDKVNFQAPFVNHRNVPDPPNKSALSAAVKKKIAALRIIYFGAQETEGEVTTALISVLKKYLPADWLNARARITFLETTFKKFNAELRKYNNRKEKYAPDKIEIPHRLDFQQYSAAMEMYDEAAVGLRATLDELVSPEYRTIEKDGYLTFVENRTETLTPGKLTGAFTERGEPYEVPDYKLPKNLTEKNFTKILAENGWVLDRHNKHAIFEKYGQSIAVPRSYSKKMIGILNRELHTKEAFIH